MDFKLSQTRMNVFSLAIKALGLSLLVSIVLNLVMAVFLMRDRSHESIVLVPASMSKKAMITDSYVSDSYLESLASMIVNERLNVTPSNIVGSNDNLLHYVDSSYYASFKAQLKRDEQTIKEDKISSSFYPQVIRSNAKELSVEIQGTLKRWVGLRSIGEVRKKYLMQFSRSGTLLLLTSFKEIKVIS